MSTKEVPLSASIKQKIAWAEYYYRQLGGILVRDRAVTGSLLNLRSAIHASHEEMKDVGIASLCKECEQKEGGSCCGAGIENKYDGWLLLINLLLDARLPSERHNSKSCYFLSESGCCLQARHVICVNYICTKITDRISPPKINSLREKEGRELNILFILLERTKEVARRSA
ncbi:MAG: hypothetical protein SV775_18335 [Thermodesulfobacteriota bacterium]|nr:hypothetical protein [Thermodesulfobacteriota bacterium]